jgi:hypothetical protein
MHHKHVPAMQKYPPTFRLLFNLIGRFLQRHGGYGCAAEPLTCEEGPCEDRARPAGRILRGRHCEGHAIRRRSQPVRRLFRPLGSNDTNRDDIFVFGDDEQIVLVSRLDNSARAFPVLRFRT